MAKSTAEPKTQVCTQHMKPVNEGGLGKSLKASRFPFDRFSKLKTGKYRKICKVCQTRLSGEWTRRMADYRKLYQKANQLVAAGFAVRVPTAKAYQAGDVIRSTNGKPFNLDRAKAKAATASA